MDSVCFKNLKALTQIWIRARALSSLLYFLHPDTSDKEEADKGKG